MNLEPIDIACAKLVKQISTVYNLDQPEVELLKTDRSKFGVADYPKCHVHDILILTINGTLFYAKGEDVYLRINSRHSLNYENFYEFAWSLFQYDECSIPHRTFCFLDEPDIPPVDFERVFVQQHAAAIRDITDTTPPSSIQHPKLRELFYFYLSRKERLVTIEGEIYDDVYNRHGRDVIHEVLASALGQLLNIPVPRNYFAYKTSRFKLAFPKQRTDLTPDYHRYVLSQAVQLKHPCPSLVEALNKQFSDLTILRDLSLYREQSNPLNLAFFQQRKPAQLHDLGNLIIERCLHHRDLIKSDFFDQVLGGTKDRKPFDYLSPQGLAGPIFTVDFGEILFPELVFLPDEQHYLEQKQTRAFMLQHYFDQVRSLPKDDLYRTVIKDLVRTIKNLDLRVLSQFIHAIPEQFLLDHFDPEQYCYQPATLIDFLAQQFQLIAEQKDF